MAKRAGCDDVLDGSESEGSETSRSTARRARMFKNKQDARTRLSQRRPQVEVKCPRWPVGMDREVYADSRCHRLGVRSVSVRSDAPCFVTRRMGLVALCTPAAATMEKGWRSKAPSQESKWSSFKSCRAKIDPGSQRGQQEVHLSGGPIT